MKTDVEIDCVAHVTSEEERESTASSCTVY